MTDPCSTAGDALWRALDGDLPSEDARALAAHLASCPRCTAAMAEAVRLHRVLNERASTGVVAATPAAIRVRVVPMWLTAALAALLAIAAGVAAWPRYHAHLRDSASVAIVESVSGEVAAVEGAQRTPLTVGSQVLSGAGVATRGPDSGVGLRFPDGTRIVLGGDARLDSLALGEEAGATIALARGTLSADVAHQSEGRSLQITTPHALARIIGTRFVLAETGDATRLDVSDGMVSFTERGSGDTVRVRSGEAAVARPGEQLRAHPTRSRVWDFESDEQGWSAITGLTAARATPGADGTGGCLRISGTFNRAWDFAHAPETIYPLPTEGLHRASLRLRVDRFEGHVASITANVSFVDAAGAVLGTIGTDAYDVSLLGTWQTLSVRYMPPAQTATVRVSLLRDPAADTAIVAALDDIVVERVPDNGRALAYAWNFERTCAPWRPPETDGDMPTLETSHGLGASPASHQSLHVHGSSSFKWVFGYTAPLAITPGRRYRLTGWLRVDTTTPGLAPSMKIETWGYADAPTARREFSRPYDLSRPGTWQEMTADIDVDPRHFFAEVALVKGAEGAAQIDAYLDRVELRPLPKP